MAVYKRGRPVKYDPTTKSGKNPPKEPGEYRIRDDSGKIIYIGETNNLDRRMHEHIRSGKLKIGEEGRFTFEYQLADKRSTSVTRRLHERVKIKQHDPALNKSGGGEGRSAKKTRKKMAET